MPRPRRIPRALIALAGTLLLSNTAVAQPSSTARLEPPPEEAGDAAADSRATVEPATVEPATVGPALSAAVVSAAEAGPDASDEAAQAGQEVARSPYPSTGSISGYMEVHFNRELEETIDPVVDFHRFVLLFNHAYSRRIRFVGELELEHAFVEGLEEAGELELEQAFVDFLVSRQLAFRAGMVLMPVGILNERHEPPVFYGVERPFVDTVIVPSTWFEVGAGVHGELRGGWRYRAYLTPPLDASRFTADEGLRGGRQKGGQATARGAALTGRVEYVGYPGLTVGGSTWVGDSAGEFGPRFDVPVRIAEVDARYGLGGLELRGQYAHVWIDNADLLNDALRRRVGFTPNIASQMRGFYLESGYRLVEGTRLGDLGAFIRYENFDTQLRMPTGLIPLAHLDRSAWWVGATYWPEPDVAIKIDFIVNRNASRIIETPNSFNIGLGWWF